MDTAFFDERIHKSLFANNRLAQNEEDVMVTKWINEGRAPRVLFNNNNNNKMTPTFVEGITNHTNIDNYEKWQTNGK